jgi:hypothetical protein
VVVVDDDNDEVEELRFKGRSLRLLLIHFLIVRGKVVRDELG